MNRIYLLLISILIVSAGCKSSFKQNFGDFRAYYNTYYNAKQSFETGLRKNEAQNKTYNPLIPIRIHLEPVNAGRTDFEQAIDKGADILRKFEDSKWVDDAIEIIGKSYYYRQEYFSADQKFQELYQATDSDKLKQRAVYWRGRTYLDMQLYTQAIDFLQTEISVFDGRWDKGLLAESKAILAQHHIALDDYESAERELSESLKNLTTKEHKARGYFLYGQLLELNGKPEEAYDAYDKVGKYYRDYNLFFAANVKKGQVARDLGLNKDSYELFESLGKDDKNFSVKADLDYEVGKALQADEQFVEAEEVYLSVLSNRVTRPSNVTVALTYYGLAEINRFYYNDFKLAAAYYDSSSKEKVAEELLPVDFDAAELAESFGEYARLTEAIELKDSLLWLGQLPEAELDSVILELKKKRKKELEDQLREAEARKNTLVTVSQNQTAQTRGSATNGFLNFKNPLLIADARSQFQAIWGDRPLVDNWRRFNAIVISISDSTETDTEEVSIYAGNANIQLSDIQIDLSAVPFTQTERDSVNGLVADELYQLGNLFFLSLQMPDSAEFYFSNVIDDHPESSSVAIAYYSYSELLYSLNETEDARLLAEDLIAEYPNSEFAARLAERYEIELIQDEIRISESDSLKVVYETLVNESPSLFKADSLRSFAKNNESFYLAPKAMLDAAIGYSELAKDSIYFENYKVFEAARMKYQGEQDVFEAYMDSIRVLKEDTTLTIAQQAAYDAILDSTFKPIDYDSLFPYFGEYWDTTRVVLDEYSTLFRASDFIDPVTRLKSELTIPDYFTIVEEVIDSTANDSLSAESALEDLAQQPVEVKFIACRDLRITPEVKGGKKAFVESLELYVLDTEEQFTITYSFKILSDGTIQEFRFIRASNIDEDTKGLVDDAIEDRLSFEALFFQSDPVNIECEVTFNLSLN